MHKFYFQMQLERNKNKPNITNMSTLTMSVGPYYIHYCLIMTLQRHVTDLCVTVSSGTIIGLIDLAIKTDKGLYIRYLKLRFRIRILQNFAMTVSKLFFLCLTLNKAPLLI